MRSHLLALAAIAAIAAAIGVHGARGPVRWHVDELYWIGGAYYGELAASAAGRAHPDWQLLPARENPPVARYAIALALRLAGQPVRDPDLLANFYIRFAGVPGAWGRDPVSHAKREAVARRASPELLAAYRAGQLPPPPPAQLWPARHAMLALAIGTAWLLYALGHAAWGPAAGLVAALGFLLHPIARAAYLFAMSDMVAIFFATAALAVAALPVAPRPSRAGALALGTGVLLGLACAAKMNALVAALALGVAGVAAAAARARSDPRGGGAVLVLLALGLAAAALAFVGVNPALHDDVVGGVRELFVEPRLTVEIQRGFGVPFLEGLPSRLAAVARLVGLWPPLLALAALGSLALGIRSSPLAARLVALWWWIAAAVVVAWIPFAIDRYAMPLLPPTALVAGGAAQAAWDALRRRAAPRPGTSQGA
ncbi:MAG: hypothetical protein KJ067_11045 [Vicinamibacteria bacterium]|nr:hypothetical protein [Vicinamibacteria bacterium]